MRKAKDTKQLAMHIPWCEQLKHTEPPPKASHSECHPIGDQDWPLDQPQLVLGMQPGSFDTVEQLFPVSALAEPY